MYSDVIEEVIPDAGCCNWTRLIVNDVRNKTILICTIINGRNAGEDISIPRIKLRPQYLTNQPREWERFQFPVRLAYAMIINKIQGQTLIKVGVWLAIMQSSLMVNSMLLHPAHAQFCNVCSRAIQALSSLAKLNIDAS
jgi:hypothetical protein